MIRLGCCRERNKSISKVEEDLSFLIALAPYSCLQVKGGLHAMQLAHVFCFSLLSSRNGSTRNLHQENKLQRTSGANTEPTTRLSFLAVDSSAIDSEIAQNQLIWMSSVFSVADGGGASMVNIPVLLGLTTLAGAIGVFSYAKATLTPEIVQGAQQLRQDSREVEVKKLVEAVCKHTREEGGKLEELRKPLEVALGMSLEQYVDAVEEGTVTTTSSTEVLLYSKADEELAGIFKESNIMGK